MKNSSYLIILLAIGLTVACYKWVSSTSAPISNDYAENSTVETIMTRTSVRTYSERPVSKETVDTLLRAAMAAPSAVNKQPWRIVVIDNRETLQYISENFSSMTMANTAQLAIVMCGDMSATLDGDAHDYWVEDVSAATENLLLAAHAVKLGAVWCGIYPKKDRVATFSKLLNLPGNIVPMACVCIGYPAGDQAPKDKWKPENIHYNSWSNTASDVMP